MKVAIINDNAFEVSGGNFQVDYFKSSVDFRSADLDEYDAIVVNSDLNPVGVDGIGVIKGIRKKTNVDIALILDAFGELDELRKIEVTNIFRKDHVLKALPKWFEYVRGKRSIFDEIKKTKDNVKEVTETINILNTT